MAQERSNSEPSGQSGPVQLKRELGLFSAVNMILAVMIGSGIFVSPGSALKYSGSVGMCIVVWIVSGVVSLLGALCYAELGTVNQRSGADYAYLMDAFGPLHNFWGRLPSFIFSWIMIPIVRPAEIAVVILTFSQYFCKPILDIFCIQDIELETQVVKAVAIVALGLVTFINASSVKLYVKIQNIFGLFKVIACLIVILGGLYELCLGHTINLAKGFEGTTLSPKNVALAFYSGLWTFDGWNAVTAVTEEVKKPEVNIPRSILISLPLVTLLYVFMNIAYMTVLSVPEMIESTAVAVSFGEKIVGKYAAVIIPVGVAFSTLGCALSVQFGVTRLCYVAAQDGFMIESLSYVHYDRLTPSPAVVVQGIASFLFILAGNIVELIEFASFLIWIFYGVAMVALLVLRRTKRDVPRPYRVPTWMPCFILLVAVYLSVTPIVTDPSPKYLASVGFSLVGVLVYYVIIYKNYQPKRTMGKLTYFVQVLFQAVPPEAGVLS